MSFLRWFLQLLSVGTPTKMDGAPVSLPLGGGGTARAVTERGGRGRCSRHLAPEEGALQGFSLRRSSREAGDEVFHVSFAVSTSSTAHAVPLPLKGKANLCLFV